MSPPISRTMSATEWGLLVSLSILWGGSFFFNVIALAAMPPLTLVTARITLAALLLYLVVRATGKTMPVDWRIWAAFATMGVLNNVIPFSLIAWGQTQIPSGLASIVNATTPFSTVLAAHLFTRDEKLTAGRVLGVLIGFGGVVAMIGADVLIDSATGHLLGQLAILAATISYALSAVFARRFARAGVVPMTAATGQFVTAALFLVPMEIVIDRPWTLAAPGASALGAVFCLAALSSCLAYIIYYRILATAGAVNLMLVTFLVPVTAILLGTLAFGERLSVHQFLGMAAIGIGLAIIDGRPVTALRRRLAGA